MNIRLKHFAAGSFAALPVLVGCAQRPDEIVPSYVPDEYYSKLSCDELEAERVRVTDTLARANVQQQKAYSNDVVGVALLGVPVSGTSNIAPEISNYKGMLEANARVQRQKGCDTAPFESSPTVKPPPE